MSSKKWFYVIVCMLMTLDLRRICTGISRKQIGVLSV